METTCARILLHDFVEFPVSGMGEGGIDGTRGQKDEAKERKQAPVLRQSSACKTNKRRATDAQATYHHLAVAVTEVCKRYLNIL